jgi:DNA-binding transcriptional ArsR family regulator
MIETVAATCRTLACDVRLAVLYHLRHGTESSAGEIAARVGLPLDWLSSHLAQLTTARFLHRRRSGAHVFYAFPPSLSSSLRFDPLPPLHRALDDPAWAAAGWQENKVVHLTSPVVAPLERTVQRSLDIVFDAATAFGNVRRLQIVRLLMQGGAWTSEAIVERLSMSPAACCRHMSKLLRRGCVRRGGRGTWAIGDAQKTAFHEALLREVEGALRAWPISELINSEMGQAPQGDPFPQNTPALSYPASAALTPPATASHTSPTSGVLTVSPSPLATGDLKQEPGELNNAANAQSP